MENNDFIRVSHLSKSFRIPGGSVAAVSDVSFVIRRGETLALVGESGCGKSTLARLILRLLEPDSGEVEMDGTRITGLSAGELRKFRKRMQMVFQDPFSSLDPRQNVYSILKEPLENFSVPVGQQKELIRKIMKDAGIPEEYAWRYPHEFSGGQRQRIGIARALIIRPELVVCDEPVAALDVSIQAKILNLLKELQKNYQLTYLFISHDLGVVNYIADRVCVMYLGGICELGSRDDIYQSGMHPYTRFLLASTPKIGAHVKKDRRESAELEGEVPSPINIPSGCSFHTRCPYAKEICREKKPELKEYDGHFCACHFPLNRKVREDNNEKI